MTGGQANHRVDPKELKRRLGPIGVWLGGTLFGETATTTRQAVAQIEHLGYAALWFGGDAPGSKEALSQAATLLAATDRMTIATGIASIWSRDAVAAASGASTLADGWPGRFLLGLGAGHPVSVDARGHTYAKPYSAMRAYLEAMDSTPYRVPLPEPAPRVLAALRPRMLELARDHAEGAHPYFTPPEHTARARRVLGPDPLLAPEQAFVLETDPQRARAAARGHTAGCLALPNYANSLHELGWDDADLTDGGSDELVDTIVAWGDAETIAERVRAHHRAGADHVALQPIAGTLTEQLGMLRSLAPVVLG